MIPAALLGYGKYTAFCFFAEDNSPDYALEKTIDVLPYPNQVTRSGSIAHLKELAFLFATW